MGQNRADRLLNIAIFSVVIICLFLAFDYSKVLNKHPQTVHQWRQCDGASIAMMYVHNELNPFSPATHNLHGDGKTVAEFPILYYIDACIISLVGVAHKDFVIRLVSLLILYLGLFHLFKIGIRLFKNKWLAMLPVVFLHASPIIAYYATTSVPDTSALAFSLVGVYYLIRYIDQGNFRYLLITIVITALAGMLKPTILVLYSSFLAMLIAAAIGRYKPLRVSIKSFMFLLLPYVAVVIWVMVARTYNSNHENITFLLDVKPIWELEKEFIDKISIRIKERWIQTYAYLPMLYYTLFTGLLFLILSNKKFNYIKTGIIVLLIGSAAYFYLFFKQFYEHDYYGIELLPLVLVLFMASIYWVLNADYKPIISNIFITVITILLVLNVYSTRKEMNNRYVDLRVWNAYYDEYLELGQKLKSIGVSYSDKFIVASDISPNISLYLMDQLGWTRFPYGLDAPMIEHYVDEGAKYLIISEKDFTVDSFMKTYTNNLILKHKQLNVFALDANSILKE